MPRLIPVRKLNTANRFAGPGMVVTVIVVSGLLTLLVGAVLRLVLDLPAGAVAVLTVLLLLERATGGWFLGVPAFDVGVFATGSAAAAFLAAFLLYLGAQLLAPVCAALVVLMLLGWGLFRRVSVR